MERVTTGFQRLSSPQTPLQVYMSDDGQWAITPVLEAPAPAIFGWRVVNNVTGEVHTEPFKTVTDARLWARQQPDQFLKETG